MLQIASRECKRSFSREEAAWLLPKKIVCCGRQVLITHSLRVTDFSLVLTWHKMRTPRSPASQVSESIRKCPSTMGQGLWWTARIAARSICRIAEVLRAHNRAVQSLFTPRAWPNATGIRGKFRSPQTRVPSGGKTQNETRR